jgi:hypothetical protein
MIYTGLGVDGAGEDGGASTGSRVEGAGKFGGKINVLDEKFDFLHSTYFKLLSQL